MQLKKVSFADTNSFSSFFLDYIQQKDQLKPFYHRYPTRENFRDQIAEKQQSFPDTAREALVATLTQQYKSLSVTEAVRKNITALKDRKTFTVTTGHQLNIFTGPLYFIYKIVTVINTCKQLKAKYPDYDFVPVYWMASEDHDYDEIKYFRLYGKKYTWKTEQQGAVGRFDTKEIGKLFDEIPGNNIQIFKEAYTKNKKLSDAVRSYVNALFGDEGLVVIDADDRDLKSLFREVVRADVFQNVNKSLVDKTNADLENLGYKTQIFCRDINFFYLDNGIRSRIERSGETFKVLDSDLSFSEEQLNRLIDEQPEKFSPNVILRPLYQEMILPNIAYVGGPAEVIYWLQLKSIFQHFNTPFPILMPRNFAMVMEAQVTRKFEKTGLDLKELFEEKNFLFNHWVLKHSPRNLTVGEERSHVNELFENLKSRAGAIDVTLSPFVGAEGKRVLNALEKIEQKLLRAEKRLHGDKLRQIEAVKDELFPNGSLQERTDNFLNFYQQNPAFIRMLLDCFDPFDFQFNVLLL
jgi:bacillithiol biosynthesis cysteine-adding enzyme BshC